MDSCHNFYGYVTSNDHGQSFEFSTRDEVGL